MFVSELETFVKKFHQLWSAGHSAHLDIDSHAGRAWVGLRVQLGHDPGPLHPPYPQPVYRRPDSPSRQRRRDRHAAARKAEEASKEENAGETDPTEEASREENAKKTDTIDIAEEAVIEDKSSEVNDDQNVESIVDLAEEASIKDMKISDEVCPDEEFDKLNKKQNQFAV